MPPSSLTRSLTRPLVAAAAPHAPPAGRRSLFPPPPQEIRGTINDPAPVPPPSPSHGSYHWTFERLLAAGLVPLTLAPFASGSSAHPALDATLCAAILVHSHLGFQGVITDYVPAREMPRVRRAANWALNAATAVVGLGLYEFETNDVGVAETVRRVWRA